MMRNRSSVYVSILLAIVCFVFLGVNVSFAGSVDLPKTGQITCYDSTGNVIACEGTGQDGEIQAGVAWPDPRFTNNGDGTVTDNLTGLMWLKDANCLGSGTWQQALDKVADFNANHQAYTCGGYTATYSDWGLPNVNELESLINAEVGDSAAWLNGKGFVHVEPSCCYWSSTTFTYDPDYAWIVSMYSGQLFFDYKAGGAYLNLVWPVRAVTTPPAAVWRTGQITSYAAGDDGALQRGIAWPAPRFLDNGDGTVTDNLTGLMWLKDANCFGNGTWQQALDKVADFNANSGSYSCGVYAAGYSDWRVPNRKELHSLTDFSRNSPSLPEGHPFLNVVQSYGYWSSTTLYNMFNAWDNAWVLDVDVDYRPTVMLNKSNINCYVWPVRAGHTGSFVNLDIKANGQDGPIVISPSTSVSIDISLDPGDKAGQNADWWIAVSTPFAPPGDWYTYVYPAGWFPGINLCAQAGLFDLAPFEVLNMTLPVGNYTFYFAIDDPDGAATGPWWGLDSVEVIVQ